MIVLATNANNLLTVNDSILIYAADELLWHRFQIVDGTWTDVDQQANPSPESADFSSKFLGYAIFLVGDNGLYHTLCVNADNAFQDLDQSSVKPNTRFTHQTVRFSNGMYLPSPGDSLFHKFTVIGGAFTDSAQGATIPL